MNDIGLRHSYAASSAAFFKDVGPTMRSIIGPFHALTLQPRIHRTSCGRSVRRNAFRQTRLFAQEQGVEATSIDQSWNSTSLADEPSSLRRASQLLVPYKRRHSHPMRARSVKDAPLSTFTIGYGNAEQVPVFRQCSPSVKACGERKRLNQHCLQNYDCLVLNAREAKQPRSSRPLARRSLQPFYLPLDLTPA
jgi:hypothetical protein